MGDFGEVPPSGDYRAAEPQPQFLRLAAPSNELPEAQMLEWKFRLVILLSALAVIAATLGDLSSKFNFGW
jgi:hypothetical protein